MSFAGSSVVQNPNEGALADALHSADSGVDSLLGDSSSLLRDSLNANDWQKYPSIAKASLNTASMSGLPNLLITQNFKQDGPNYEEVDKRFDALVSQNVR